MNETGKMIGELTLAKDQYELALNMNIGVAAAKERMKNVAFNYFGELLGCAKRCGELEEQVAALNVALEDSDKELAKLRAATPKKKAE